MGKGRFLDDKLVQIISQEVCTCSSSMTVKHAKEGTFGPLLSLSRVRFQNIENDTNSVLIIGSNDSLVGVGSISSHYSILLVRTFGSVNSSVEDL
jgi:hypothetical protein